MEMPDIRRLYKSLMPFKSSNQQWLDKISFADTCVALQSIMFERSCLLPNIEEVQTNYLCIPACCNLEENV